MSYLLEEVYRTEGVPEFTFVKPPNFNEILVDMRNPKKPVVIEGQSGTGKTTIVRKIIEANLQLGDFKYLSARKSADSALIAQLSDGNLLGSYIIDDFHRLDSSTQEKIANIVKLSAEETESGLYPKVVIIGINKVGSELIHLVHDIAKRCGIHKVNPAGKDKINELISKGEEKLNVTFANKDELFEESAGDYWLAQLLCQSICMINDVIESCDNSTPLSYQSIEQLRSKVVSRIENAYENPVKEFCRGRRFRSTNDPYFRLLKTISEQESSIVDLNELANANDEVKWSINSIKEHRINVLLESKPLCERYFYYNNETKSFAIEDPALFYYLQHLHWSELRKACGFRDNTNEFEYDFALSFAGENRDLAKSITDLLTILDCTVFYDAYFEANFLGEAWQTKFTDIFSNKSRFVVCLLDEHHSKKIWPTFERECFSSRVKDASVIPIYLDDTRFVGIPNDTIGISFKNKKDATEDLITDEIVLKLEEKLNKT